MTRLQIPRRETEKPRMSIKGMTLSEMVVIQAENGQFDRRRVSWVRICNTNLNLGRYIHPIAAT
jgi:hypothetical protein